MVRILCRGRFFAALAITIGSITAGWTPATAATLTVGKAAPNADPIIPVNVGDKLGIFKKHGLDLTIASPPRLVTVVLSSHPTRARLCSLLPLRRVFHKSD